MTHDELTALWIGQQCETTLTQRFAIPDCTCETYEGNLGPCETWSEPLQKHYRCAYCDHNQDCHKKLVRQRIITGPDAIRSLLDEVKLRDKTMLEYESHIKELLEALEPFMNCICVEEENFRQAKDVWDKHQGDRD